MLTSYWEHRMRSFLLYESAQTDMDSKSLCKTWCSAWFDVYKFKRVSCFSMKANRWDLLYKYISTMRWMLNDCRHNQSIKQSYMVMVNGLHVYSAFTQWSPKRFIYCTFTHSLTQSYTINQSINQLKKKHIKPNEIYKKLSKRIQWMHVLFIHSYRPPPESNSPSILQKKA